MPPFTKTQATSELDDLLDAVRENFNPADRAILYARFLFMLKARHNNPNWEKPHGSDTRPDRQRS